MKKLVHKGKRAMDGSVPQMQWGVSQGLLQEDRIQTR